MSRTIRRQKGNRWWKEQHRCKHNMHNSSRRWFINPEPAIAYTWKEIEKELVDNTIRYEKKGKISRHSAIMGLLKWHSNWFVRARNRAELHKVIRFEDYEYDHSHDLMKKKLIWNYD